MSARRLVVAVVVSVTVLAAAPRAVRAAPGAHALFERAKKAYVQARVEKALKLLRRAAKRVRDIQLAAQIELYRGLSLLVLKDHAHAKAAFVRALRNDPTLSLDAARFKPSTVALLEAIKASAHGTLVVTANRPASVSLDGKDVGKTPLTLKVKIGKHQVQVRAGDARFVSEIVMGLDAQLSVPAHLPLSGKVTGPVVKATGPGVGGVGGAGGAAGGAGAGGAGAGGADGGAGAAARDSGGHRLWTWITLGTALASAGVGVALGLSAKSDHEEYLTTPDYDRFNSLESAAKTKATAANVLFVGAGVLAAGAVALFFIEGHLIARRAREQSTSDDLVLRVVPSAGPHGAQIGLVGSF